MRSKARRSRANRKAERGGIEDWLDELRSIRRMAQPTLKFCRKCPTLPAFREGSVTDPHTLLRHRPPVEQALFLCP